MSAHELYWTEAVASAFDEHGIAASDEQITRIAGDIEVSHENFGLAFPAPPGPSPMHREIEELSRRLEEEERKVLCRMCRGEGRITEHGPVHSVNFECSRCRGEGRHTP